MTRPVPRIAASTIAGRSQPSVRSARCCRLLNESDNDPSADINVTPRAWAAAATTPDNDRIRARSAAPHDQSAPEHPNVMHAAKTNAGQPTTK